MAIHLGNHLPPIASGNRPSAKPHLDLIANRASILLTIKSLEQNEPYNADSPLVVAGLLGPVRALERAPNESRQPRDSMTPRQRVLAAMRRTTLPDRPCPSDFPAHGSRGIAKKRDILMSDRTRNCRDPICQGSWQE
jgi:hypothetical protein